MTHRIVRTKGKPDVEPTGLLRPPGASSAPDVTFELGPGGPATASGRDVAATAAGRPLWPSRPSPTHADPTCQRVILVGPWHRCVVENGPVQSSPAALLPVSRETANRPLVPARPSATSARTRRTSRPFFSSQRSKPAAMTVTRTSSPISSSLSRSISLLGPKPGGGPAIRVTPPSVDTPARARLADAQRPERSTPRRSFLERAPAASRFCAEWPRRDDCQHLGPRQAGKRPGPSTDVCTRDVGRGASPGRCPNFQRGPAVCRQSGLWMPDVRRAGPSEQTSLTLATGPGVQRGRCVQGPLTFRERCPGRSKPAAPAPNCFERGPGTHGAAMPPPHRFGCPTTDRGSSLWGPGGSQHAPDVHDRGAERSEPGPRRTEVWSGGRDRVDGTTARKHGRGGQQLRVGWAPSFGRPPSPSDLDDRPTPTTTFHVKHQRRTATKRLAPERWH